MSVENLKFWIDKDGKKLPTENSKYKYNKKLEYLMSNNPNDVISKKAIILRKLFHPIYIRTIPFLSTNSKLVVVRREKIPKDRPIIFVSTHGFRDDIAMALKTAKEHAYLVYASLPDFYYSIDGKILNLNGVYIMDRLDKESKNALRLKIKRGNELGVKNIIICPEGVWCKDPNAILEHLWPGIYHIAKDINGIIMPIASLNKNMKIDNDKHKKVYSILGKPIDITEYSEEEGLEIVRDAMATYKYELLDKYSKSKRDTIGDPELYWNNYVKELIETSKGLYDYRIENSAQYNPKGIVDESEVFKPLENITPSIENSKIYVKTRNIYKKKREH